MTWLHLPPARPAQGFLLVVAVVSVLVFAPVGLLIGGGSGHEPLFPAFIGLNMADGAACGNIFAAPTPDVILAVTKAVHRGKGVLYAYENYDGDVMNFDMAGEMAAMEDIDVRTNGLEKRTPGGYRVVNQAYVHYFEKHEGRSYE